MLDVGLVGYLALLLDPMGASERIARRATVRCGSPRLNLMIRHEVNRRVTLALIYVCAVTKHDDHVEGEKSYYWPETRWRI